MSAHLTLVVGGAPALAQALQATGTFTAVHAVGSTSQLRDLVGSGQLPTDRDRLVFIFADNLAVDTPQTPLDALVGRLVSSGRRVIVLGVTPNAQTIVAAHRQAGLLTGPFTLNATLGAIAGLGLGMVPPSEAPGAYEQFDPVAGPVPDLTAPAPAQPAPAQPAPAEQAGGWEQAWGQPAEPEGQSNSWEQVGGAGIPDAWRTPPQVDQPAPVQPDGAPEPAPRTPEPAAPAPAPAPAAGGRSLAAVADKAPAGRSLAEARPTPDTSAWEQAGGWDSAPAQPEQHAPAPVSRGGLNVVHNQRRARRGWVITITSAKGGTGKTSLSINLAAFLGLHLRNEGKTVCLIDNNYGQADAGKILDVYAPNIVDLARDPSAIHVDRIAQHLVHRPDLNMSALLGPASPKDANPVYITPKLYNQVLDVLQELYDYVIIDTQVAERFSSMHAEFSTPRADRLIIPVNPNLATLMNADAWLRSICEPVHAGGLGYDESKVGILLNMAMEGVDCDVEDVMRELGSWTFVGAIPMTSVWQKALNNNDLVATYNYEELNQAFSAVLYAATGEPAMLQHYSGQAVEPDQGLAGKLMGLLRKGKR